MQYKIVRYLRFMCSTLGGTVVDCFLMWLIAECLFPANVFVAKFVAPTVSFECAVFTNYLLAYFFVWHDRINKYEERKHPYRRFLSYNISCLFSFGIKMIPFLLFYSHTSIPIVYCNLLALSLSGIFTFVMNEWVIFKKTMPQDSTLDK